MKPFNKIDLEHVVELALYMHQAERNLRERGARYRGPFEDAHDAILIYSGTGQIVLDLNQRACQIYGDKVVMNSSVCRLPVSPRTVYLAMKLSNSCSRRISPSAVPLSTSVKMDGKSPWKPASLIPYQGQQAILSINRDVTSRIQEEKELDRYRRQLEVMVHERTAELKLANEQLRVQVAALASTANGIIITDRDANIIWSNPAFSQLTGYESQEIIGKKTFLVSSGTHTDEDYAHMWQTILSSKTWKGELTNRRKNGSLYVAELIVTPVRDDAGQNAILLRLSRYYRTD